jgi:hypothetical protein
MIELIDIFRNFFQETIEEIPFTEYEELESKPLEFLK